MQYEMEKKKLELKVSWKISRNDSAFKENFFLRLGEFESEIAPNVRYHEDPKLIESNYKELLKAQTMNMVWCNSFQSAVNNILLKKQFNNDLFKALELPEVKGVPTSFSIPIMEPSEVEAYLKANSQYHFYKLKVADLGSLPLLKEVAKQTQKPLRIDANEGFKSLSEYLEFEKELDGMNIQFIEQPFGTSMVEEYFELRKISKYELMADESLLLDFNGEKFQKMFHGINVKIMKTRGLENGKKLLLKAKKFGLKTMVGCMIESSLGISEALHLASLCDYVDLDGALLLKDDPYAHLIKEQDGLLTLNK